MLIQRLILRLTLRLMLRLMLILMLGLMLVSWYRSTAYGLSFLSQGWVVR